jgi:endogenous inhibitor of DNA gyrase (YacG/DUF329 family)
MVVLILEPLNPRTLFFNMKIKCPTCKQSTEWEKNPNRPFCSERCKLIDLGAWASDEYTIEGNLEDESGE